MKSANRDDEKYESFFSSEAFEKGLGFAMFIELLTNVVKSTNTFLNDTDLSILARKTVHLNAARAY